jgi:large subunit ribosomal protein L13
MKIKRNHTYIPTKSDIQHQWYILDAKDKILGRLAAKVASVLRGKHKPSFVTHLDIGDGVIVINAKQVRVTGRKLEQKVYERYSGYPGGHKEVRLEEMLAKKPELVIQHSVRNMLPNNKLRELALKRLKIYKDASHPHISQHPLTLEV